MLNQRGAIELIGIWVLVRPLVLDSARVKENCFSLSSIPAPSCQSWWRASTGRFLAVLPHIAKSVGERQRQSGQAMCEKQCDSGANRTGGGQCRAEARLQTGLEKNGSQSVRGDLCHLTGQVGKASLPRRGAKERNQLCLPESSQDLGGRTCDPNPGLPAFLWG
jgi:hypothetical protein